MPKALTTKAGALAMGLASNPRARIAAMDELSARYMRAHCA